MAPRGRRRPIDVVSVLYRHVNVDVTFSCSLDEEIRTFTRYMEPTSQEVRMRADLVQRFTTLITSFNINASIRPVGSYVTGLYLPTSDIDMVITFPFHQTLTFRSGHSSSLCLFILIGKIRESGFASKIEDVLRARVPLIRITDKITGIQIDLTAGKHAVKATEAVQEWLQHSSPAKPLLFVLKMFLLIRRCGTTYTGGINSYALFWMVVAWVKLEMPKKKPVASYSDYDPLTMALAGLSVSKESAATSSSNSDGVDLGELLVKFLKFYGDEFDYERNAIQITPTPGYFTKTYGYSRYRITQRYLLSIFDPADSDTSIDMGSKVYGIKHIQESFKNAYQSLADLESKRKSGQWAGEAGILGSVLGGDYTKFVEMRRLAVAQISSV